MNHPWDVHHKRSVRKWHDPRVAMMHSSKDNARTHNREHTITKEDIKIPVLCPVFGFKLKAGGKDYNSMSIDRHDTSLGYTPENIRVISWKANRLKSNGSLEDFEKLVEYLKKS